ncbi:MAG: DUF2973 domain-containing protein [Cyanobacteria bacterium J007]|nr:MAG: DUF2973 domain-containing protein [Cyanobacteria bacterium J007]
MLHLLYILAFTILAFLAVGNLIRSLVTLSSESSRTYPPKQWNQQAPTSPVARSQGRPTPHPELLDASGQVVSEPLMVMKSMSVDDVRERLDALYDSSPGKAGERRDEV